jgi:hypothetical protein
MRAVDRTPRLAAGPSHPWQLAASDNRDGATLGHLRLKHLLHRARWRQDGRCAGLAEVAREIRIAMQRDEGRET